MLLAFYYPTLFARPLPFFPPPQKKFPTYILPLQCSLLSLVDTQLLYYLSSRTFLLWTWLKHLSLSIVSPSHAALHVWTQSWWRVLGWPTKLALGWPICPSWEGTFRTHAIMSCSSLPLIPCSHFLLSK